MKVPSEVEADVNFYIVIGYYYRDPSGSKNPRESRRAKPIGLGMALCHPFSVEAFAWRKAMNKR
jgi:hypothetical protein